MAHGRSFAAASSWIANAAGRPWVFVGAAVAVGAWAVSGPLLHFSDTWQLVMNTVSSVVTFLMVFLIQNAQESRQRGHARQARHAAGRPGEHGQPLHRHRAAAGR